MFTCLSISGLQTIPTYKTFGGHKVYRYRRRRKSSELIGEPSPTRSKLTIRTLHGHYRNDRQLSARYHKSSPDFKTHSNCFRQWHSWENSFSRIRGHGDSRGTRYYTDIKWLSWRSQLHLLSDMHVPRWIEAQKHKLQDCEVYVFGDASERAYGAVIYLKSITDDAVTVRLTCSKAKLAPIKVKLPRLEFLAAIIATRLLRYFCQATEYDIFKATLWSDLAIALAWIRDNPNRWKTFVNNRLTDIRIHGTISVAPLSRIRKPGRYSLPRPSRERSHHV